MERLLGDKITDYICTIAMDARRQTASGMVRVNLSTKGEKPDEIRQKFRRRPTPTEHTHTHTQAHLIVHCGLGIGLATGKCLRAERIGEQGGDVGYKRIGNGVAAKTVARFGSGLIMSNNNA
jgi:hypothetical protein